MSKLTCLCAGVLAAWVVVACGDDDDDVVADGGDAATGEDGSIGSGGRGTGGKSGGSGGRTSSGGAGGKGGSSGSGGAESPDASPEAGPDALPDGDAGPITVALCAGMSGDDLLDCGKYLVDHIEGCADCHSPRGPQGLDPAKLLAGNPAFADLDPEDDTKGLLPAPNLTALAEDGWTVADVVEAIREGRNKDGEGLVPVMPYPTMHNLADEDAEAIATYILSLDLIENDIPARQPLPFPLTLPVPTFDPGNIPDPVGVDEDDVEEAMLGKYLASAGPCMECHTERTEEAVLDTSKLFAGGERYDLPSPPFPPVVYSQNITPAPTGIQGWTAEMVKTVIKQGTDPDGNGVCPPMPVGPMGAFGGMTDEHALAIGLYITHLEPIENGLDGGGFPQCSLPPAPPPDGGAPDASSDASADAN